MIKLIVKKTVREYENTQNPAVRERYCVLSGILGIICNLFLFALKMFIGTTMGSIAIVSDGLNNLSDTGSSFVSIIGAKLSNKKPDREHPFGHGRFEYITSLIVAFIIILVGFELFKSALGKTIKPEPLAFNLVMTGVLLCSAFIKVWMFIYNRFLGKQIHSGILLAVAKDSLNDVISTVAVVISTAVVAIGSQFPQLSRLDGIVGIIVSVMIVKSGVDIARDTVGRLLGTPPDKETVDQIVSIVCAGAEIVGVHDLIVHDYGPGRVMASVHAEVPDNSEIIKIHEVIDELEKRVEAETGIHIVIHMDPISVNCEKTDQIKKMVISRVKEIDKGFNIHDFRMTDGENKINLIFDLEVPAGFEGRDELTDRIGEMLKEVDVRFNAVINMDTVYD